MMLFQINLVILLRNFQNIFPSVYSGSCSGTFPSVNQCAKILHLAPISNFDVQNAMKQLRPSKSVGLNGTPIIFIKGCFESFVPVLGFIFNLSLYQNNFLTCVEASSDCPYFQKKEKLPLLVITGP
jgi:hypothetical protein